MVANEDKIVKALVVGYGSIGQRHARILKELDCMVSVVSRRSILFSPHYANTLDALRDWQPDYVVVADRTVEHRPTIETLVQHGFQGRVLVEKPLYDKYYAFPPHEFSNVAVGYNLRCHPLLRKLKRFLDKATTIISAYIYVGSYLPDWRQNRDYRESYSAKKNEGGGVLRDLSHELDYALWLFGPWRRITAMGGHLSPLEIDSDDAYCLLMETPRCPMVSIHMNYFDKTIRREISVNTDQHTAIVDLIGNKIEIAGNEEMVDVKRDDTFRSEHRAMLAKRAEGLCTLEEAMETLFTIESAERAAELHEWIER